MKAKIYIFLILISVIQFVSFSEEIVSKNNLAPLSYHSLIKSLHTAQKNIKKIEVPEHLQQKTLKLEKLLKDLIESPPADMDAHKDFYNIIFKNLTTLKYVDSDLLLSLVENIFIKLLEFKHNMEQPDTFYNMFSQREIFLQYKRYLYWIIKLHNDEYLLEEILIRFENIEIFKFENIFSNKELSEAAEEDLLLPLRKKLRKINITYLMLQEKEKKETKERLKQKLEQEKTKELEKAAIKSAIDSIKMAMNKVHTFREMMEIRKKLITLYINARNAGNMIPELKDFFNEVNIKLKEVRKLEKDIEKYDISDQDLKLYTFISNSKFEHFDDFVNTLNLRTIFYVLFYKNIGNYFSFTHKGDKILRSVQLKINANLPFKDFKIIEFLDKVELLYKDSKLTFPISEKTGQILIGDTSYGFNARENAEQRTTTTPYSDIIDITQQAKELYYSKIKQEIGLPEEVLWQDLAFAIEWLDIFTSSKSKIDKKQLIEETFKKSLKGLSHTTAIKLIDEYNNGQIQFSKNPEIWKEFIQQMATNKTQFEKGYKSLKVDQQIKQHQILKFLENGITWRDLKQYSLVYGNQKSASQIFSRNAFRYIKRVSELKYTGLFSDFNFDKKNNRFEAIANKTIPFIISKEAFELLKQKYPESKIRLKFTLFKMELIIETDKDQISLIEIPINTKFQLIFNTKKLDLKGRKIKLITDLSEEIIKKIDKTEKTKIKSHKETSLFKEIEKIKAPVDPNLLELKKAGIADDVAFYLNQAGINLDEIKKYAQLYHPSILKYFDTKEKSHKTHYISQTIHEILSLKKGLSIKATISSNRARFYNQNIAFDFGPSLLQNAQKKYPDASMEMVVYMDKIEIKMNTQGIGYILTTFNILKDGNIILPSGKKIDFKKYSEKSRINISPFIKDNIEHLLNDNENRWMTKHGFSSDMITTLNSLKIAKKDLLLYQKQYDLKVLEKLAQQNEKADITVNIVREILNLKHGAIISFFKEQDLYIAYINSKKVFINEEDYEKYFKTTTPFIYKFLDKVEFKQDGNTIVTMQINSNAELIYDNNIIADLSISSDIIEEKSEPKPEIKSSISEVFLQAA